MLFLLKLHKYKSTLMKVVPNEDAHLTVNGSTLNDERSPSTYVCVFV